MPVPSGLFNAGHDPGDRPCRRAGYARDRLVAGGSGLRRSAAFTSDVPTDDREKIA
jgi:hypothetical protein